MRKGQTHTEAAKEKIRQAHLKRYALESPEQKAARIQKLKDFWKRIDEEEKKRIYDSLEQAHIEFVKREYERLHAMGEI